MKRPEFENVTRFDVIRDYGASPGEPGEAGDYVSSDDYDELIRYVKVLEKGFELIGGTDAKAWILPEAERELFPEATP